MTASARLPVLIAGAGPTGLAAALFLRRRGIDVRIIDMAQEPSKTSKALLVNPRTLEILQESGVAARVMTEGWRVTGATMHRNDKQIVSLNLLDLLPGQPLIGLAQSRTEALLTVALQAQGVTVERGVSIVTVQQDATQVTCTLQHADGHTETTSASFLFGADGARSVVRKQLGLSFDGHSLPEPWKLWDLRLRTDLDAQRAHIVLVPDGLIFMMALQGDLWRVLGNGANPLDALPGHSTPGEVTWQSDFHIAHRLASHVCVERVALGGDAAHIHSPLGARGMNLGIEDAWVYTDCAVDALAGDMRRMAEYETLRHPIHRSVVHRIEAITRLMRGRPALLRTVRDRLIPQVAKLPFARRGLAQTISGLDHPLRTRL